MKYVVINEAGAQIKIPDGFLEIRKYIVPTFVNRKKHLDLLSSVPHRDVLDLSVVYKIMLEHDNGYCAATIDNELMEIMELSQEELEYIGERNLQGLYMPEILEVSENMMVFTNRQKFFGAAGILDGDALEEVADEWQGDFYLLPSSVHEMILVPEGRASERALREMVREANENFVSEDEFLSNNIYKYDSLKHSVSIV